MGRKIEKLIPFAPLECRQKEASSQAHVSSCFKSCKWKEVEGKPKAAAGNCVFYYKLGRGLQLHGIGQPQWQGSRQSRMAVSQHAKKRGGQISLPRAPERDAEVSACSVVGGKCALRSSVLTSEIP